MRLNFDIRAYLRDRLPSHFEENSRGMLIGACLYHRDGRRPNLAIFDNGSYRCLSCGARGDRVSLVQRIEQFATYDEAAAWLFDNYGIDDGENADNESFELSLGDFSDDETTPASVVWTPPAESILDAYKWRHAYLATERGISELWQVRFNIGYDKRRKAITFPWRDRTGRLITVKLRPTWTKSFFYDPPVPGGVKNSLLYGLHHVQRRRDKVVWIPEAEICAMSLWASGRPAAATGGSFFSEEQARELAMAGVETVVPVGDRDEAGARLNAMIAQRVARYGIAVAQVVWPDDCNAKDPNELLLAGRIDELNIDTESNGFSLGKSA